METTTQTRSSAEGTDQQQQLPARTAVTSAVVASVLGIAVAIAFVLVVAHSIVLTVFGALVIAESTRPFVDRLSKSVPRGVAVLLVFAALLLLIAAAWWVVFSQLAPQFGAFVQALPTYGSQVVHLLQQIKANAPAQIANMAPQSAPAGPILNALLGAGISVATAVTTIALALLLAIFWIDASAGARAFFLSVIQPNRRAEADELFSDMGRQLGQYALGTLVNGAIVAAGSILALLILRTPFPIVLGLVQGLLVALPYVGTFIGVVLVGAIVLPAQGWLSALIAMAAIAVIASIEGSFIAPRVFKKGLDVDPFSTTLAVALGGTLFGTGGILLAVPAAAVLKTLAVRVVAPAIRRTHGDA